MTDKNSTNNTGIIRKTIKMASAKSCPGSLTGEDLSATYNTNNVTEGISIETYRKIEEKVMIF